MFSDFLKYFENLRKSFGFFENSFPKSMEDISVTLELDSESLTTLRKNIFKRGSCKFLRT